MSPGSAVSFLDSLVIFSNIHAGDHQQILWSHFPNEPMGEKSEDHSVWAKGQKRESQTISEYQL